MLESEFPDDADYDGYEQTEKDHGRKWKIKPEILSFHTDITWQPPNPVQLVMEKVKNDS
jgi:hypothetical protein